MTTPDATAARLEAARWEAILGTAFDAIVSIDRAGRITLFNRAAESIFGYAAAEVLGRPVELLMPAPYRDEHADYVRRYEETGIPRAIGRIRKVDARRKSGEVFPIELSVSQAQVGDDVIYSAIIRDVTVQSRLEHELRAYGRREASLARLGLAALEEQPLRLLQQATDLVCEVLGFQLAAVLLMSEQRALVVRAATGWRTDVVDRLHLDAGPSSQAGLTLRSASPLVIDDLARETRFAPPRILRDEGVVTGLSVPIGPPRRPLGMLAAFARTRLQLAPETLNFVQSVANVLAEAIGRREAEEERRRLVRRARQRERLADIGTLTAKVLHDLGNPLAGLAMTAESILRRIERAPNDRLASVRPGVERLLGTMRRLDTLLSEFKGFAREHDFEPREVALRPFLDEVLALWEPEAEKRGIDLRVAPVTGNPVVRGDPDGLHRLFDNLIKNALEAIGEGPGTIDVSVDARDAERVAITVADDGPGLPPDIDVFALFATTKSEGTGLGLPSCRQVVEAHGGRIHALPQRPHGTAFRVELPRPGPS